VGEVRRGGTYVTLLCVLGEFNLGTSLWCWNGVTNWGKTSRGLR
jgi:hypothetical protein